VYHTGIEYLAAVGLQWLFKRLSIASWINNLIYCLASGFSISSFYHAGQATGAIENMRKIFLEGY